MLDIRHGIKTRCKFLPTPADVAELVAEKHKAREFIRPGTSGYRRLTAAEEDRIERPPGPDRQRQVRELLGYDPLAPEQPVRREALVPPGADDMAALAKTARLKPPAVSDATPELKAKLMNPNEENWT